MRRKERGVEKAQSFPTLRALLAALIRLGSHRTAPAGQSLQPAEITVAAVLVPHARTDRWPGLARGAPPLTDSDASADAQASNTLTGRASIIDGDTIEIHGQRVRLWGIDAPEGRQRCSRSGTPWRCGTEAANALDRFIASQPITCIERDRDRYRRIVALCKVSGEDIGAWLVRNGWALDYAKYSGGTYAREQSQARSERRGIWQGEFEAPWEWRRR